MQEEQIVFPTEPHVAEVNARTMILFGKEKCGKTTALTKLENCLIIDTEEGTRLIDALALKVPEDRGPVGKMAWLKRVGEKLIEDGKKYDYIALDTLSEVNDWAEWSGTFRYMNSIQGKSFNRIKDSTLILQVTTTNPFIVYLMEMDINGQEKKLLECLSYLKKLQTNV